MGAGAHGFPVASQMLACPVLTAGVSGDHSLKVQHKMPQHHLWEPPPWSQPTKSPSIQLCVHWAISSLQGTVTTQGPEKPVAHCLITAMSPWPPTFSCTPCPSQPLVTSLPHHGPSHPPQYPHPKVPALAPQPHPLRHQQTFCLVCALGPRIPSESQEPWSHGHPGAMTLSAPPL